MEWRYTEFSAFTQPSFSQHLKIWLEVAKVKSNRIFRLFFEIFAKIWNSYPSGFRHTCIIFKIKAKQGHPAFENRIFQASFTSIECGRG